ELPRSSAMATESVSFRTTNTVNLWPLYVGCNNVFLSKVIDRMGMNDKIFTKLMDEPEFQAAVKEWIMGSVYRKLNQDGTPPTVGH
ncbi:hypothetical protein, partial [Alicyclobacillus macrosporangiidus]